jgi:hypothetical protein
MSSSSSTTPQGVNDRWLEAVAANNVHQIGMRCTRRYSRMWRAKLITEHLANPADAVKFVATSIR